MATIVARRRFSLFFAMIAGAAMQPAIAQCTTGFVRGAPMPGTNGDVYAIAAWDPDGAGPLPPRLAIGGKFFVAGDQVVENIASFDPATDEWAPIGNGLGTPVRALAALPNGDLVAGGEFVAAAMTQVDCVARWNGTAWLPMGNGLPGGVTSLLTMSNGDLIAAGSFTIASGAPADHVARWNGAAWQPIGTPPTFYGVQTLFETASGALLVGGDGGILQWNGVSWSAIVGSPGTRAITQLPNGDLLASTHLGVARWNGATWQNWGPGLNGVQTLLALPNGGLLVGGYLSSVTFPWSQVFAYGDGTSWVGIGQDWGEVYGMLKWPNGDVYAVGTFANPDGTPSWRIGRWRNGAWSALGPTCFDRDIVSMTKLRNGGLVVAGGFTRTPDGPAWTPVGEVRGRSPYVAAMLAMDDGTVVAAGRFDTIASLVSPHFARLVSTCPATNTTFGSGCAGSGGANVLRATSLPWIGASWNVRATGLASNTFAARVVGFATQHVRLRPLLPPADPACELLVTPDALDLAVASNGVATASLALPASPPLVGVVLHQQMIPFELDALGNVVLITATNGVRGVVGVL